MKKSAGRRVFFWVLCVSYVITTTCVLFFVFGYKHDATQNIFVHTGSLTLTAHPSKDISITIDDEEHRTKLVNFINDSYYVNGLFPQTYDVTVTKEGFQPWHKTISIHSGVSTEFWNITLIRKQYDRLRYSADHIDRFFPAPKENIFALTKTVGTTLSVSVFDTDDNVAIHTFLFPRSTFTTNDKENIEWSTDSKNLIIPLEDADHTKDYAIAYTETDTTIRLSEHLAQKDIRNVRWDPDKKNVIHFLSGTTLYRAEIVPQKPAIVLTSVADDVFAYDFTDDGLYILTKTYHVLHSADIHKTAFKEITQCDTHIQDPRNIRLIAYDTQRFVVLNDETHALSIYNKGIRDIYTQNFPSNIVGAQFSDDGKKILFYSPFEIFVYFTRDWEAQPIRSENDMYSIIRFSDNIRNIHFSKDYEHVIYTVHNKINITELDYRGNRITQTILPLHDDATILINKQKKNELFFIDSDSTTRQLQSITIPEKDTLF